MDSLLLSPGTSAGGASRGPSPARLSGSTLVRLLSGLADVDAPESSEGFTERLSRWLEWTDAISLASALNAGPAPAANGARTAASASSTATASTDEREVDRVRAALAKLVTGERIAAADARRSSLPVASRRPPVDEGDDFPAFRRLYLARQQSMDAAIAPLRQRLRARLSSTSPALAQLAALDDVMERVLGARERALLGLVPHWLERRFERLRRDHLDRQAAQAAQAAQAGPSSPDAPAPPAPPARPAPPAWLDVFRRDLQAVLLAELELRMQPVEGLLDALRPPEADTPSP